RNAARFAGRSWTCGRRSASPPSRRVTPRRPESSPTSSISSSILGSPWTKFASRRTRLSGKDRRFIKGQKDHLLSRWENLSLAGRRALKLLFQVNRRLNKAYLLKESFEQLWDYQRPGWARRFFDNWRDSLKWQRLEPFQKFAKMIEAHWDVIEAYC